MNLDYTAEEIAFRERVRRFVRQNLPEDIAFKVHNHRRLRKEDYVRWQKVLAREGWSVPLWPRDHGGPGWTSIEQHIFDEECSAAGAPRIVAFGPNYVGPVIMEFGNAAQKAYYLPRIREADDWWCQGYSEPGSGSDLASLRTRAVREGDHYVVNGQKTWNTLGQYADMMFCLVRTDSGAKKQDGISFLLIDMKSPGISVRPIELLDGSREVNDIFFDDVRVPVENLIGEEGKGWTYAKFLLGYERTGIARIGENKRELARLKAIARSQVKNGRPLAEDPLFAQRIAWVETELMALEITLLRTLTSRAKPGPESSILKIKGSDIQQAITDLAMRALGPYAAPSLPEALEGDWRGEPVGADYAAPLAGRYFNYRKTSIYGGSNEIQRNIIAQRVLGL